MRAVETTYVVPWLEGGGAQESLFRLARATGHEDSRLVILFRGSRHHEHGFATFGDVVDLGLPRTGLGAARAARALGQFVRVSSRVHSLMRGSHVCIGLMPDLTALKGKLAMSFHMLPADDRTGVAWRLEDWAVRRACRVATLVTSPSRRAIQQLHDFGIAREDRTVYVPNPLRRQTTPAQSPRSAEGRPVRLLCAGRLEPQKGFDRIPAYLQGCAVPAHVVVAGAGTQEAALRDVLSRAPRPHRVEMVGRVDDLTASMDWADAVWMPSRAELNPLVVWEAWQRGRPVISTSLPVFQDLAREGPLLLADDGPELDAALLEVRQQDFRRAAFRDGRSACTNTHGHDHLTSFLKGTPP